jgi:hypothetical protein
MKLCSPEGRAFPAKRLQVADRPRSLQGLRIGLLDNTKPPVDKIMQHLERRLRERIPGARPFYLSKKIMNQPAGPAVMDTLRQQADVVINGLAD